MTEEELARIEVEVCPMWVRDLWTIRRLIAEVRRLRERITEARVHTERALTDWEMRGPGASIGNDGPGFRQWMAVKDIDEALRGALAPDTATEVT